MAKLKSEINLIEREGENGFTLLESEYSDLRRHVESMLANEYAFWSGLQWCLAGGAISAFIATGGYHLFGNSPNGYALIIGYILTLSMLVMTLIIFLRQREYSPSFSHHKDEALRILNRIVAEGWRTETNETEKIEGMIKETENKSLVDSKLFTDLRDTKNKL